ncbi:MAG: hypothetical protein KC535_05065 [Nanoarchaeota archaeon]|nr:hypothetical protein [Nanoarchaeota archaeon]
MEFIEQIRENNKHHDISSVELTPLLEEANKTYQEQFDDTVFFERSLFINWTCGIADCKYCYLSTQPKQAKHAIRHPASIYAEALICKLMGWKVGYITGGLRVEEHSYIINLLDTLHVVLGEQIMMNFGPYTKSEVSLFKPHVTGMGSAIESFDEELHNYICPSKPLKALKNFLGHLQEQGMKKLITIILGMGEKKEDVQEVIAQIKNYDINIVQLCFLKPQEHTVFDDVPSPDPNYMAWWIAQLRIAIPTLHIKVALVRERISDTSLYLQAGANNVTRFMVFKDFASEYAAELEEECKKAHRRLQGHFSEVPPIDIDKEVNQLALEENLKEQIRSKAKQYYERLLRCQREHEAED